MKLNRDAESKYRLQDYGTRPEIDGVSVVTLRRFNDDGGAMIELFRGPEPPPGLEAFELEQINYSTLQPGTIKAFHVHRRQTDVWFVPPEDRVLVVLVDVRAAANGDPALRMVLGDGKAMLLRIPPGVAHGCRNLGDRAARIIYFTDRLFTPDPENCDEGRLPWDYVGPEVWEVARE